MGKNTFQQAMLIGIGLMVAIGFSGVFTYGNLINSGSTGDQDGQEINASLPSENYIEESYELSVQEQAYLAINNQAVFVNVLYEEENTNQSQLQGIPGQFNNSVYINAVNMSESTFASGVGAEAPSALVIGDQPAQTQRGQIPYSIRESRITEPEVVSTICSAKRDVSSFGATCYS